MYMTEYQRMKKERKYESPKSSDDSLSSGDGGEVIEGWDGNVCSGDDNSDMGITPLNG